MEILRIGATLSFNPIGLQKNAANIFVNSTVSEKELYMSIAIFFIPFKQNYMRSNATV